MVNVHKQIMSTLNTILPTYYELFCDSTTAVPCITYMESSNYAIDEGETLGYSRVGFTVKVWDTNIAHAQTIAESVDSKLRKLGFKRTSSN